MTKVNLSHAASGHNFSSVTGKESNSVTANSSQESNILHCFTAGGVFKDTEVIKKHPRNVSDKTEVKWLMMPYSSIEPITGSITGVCSNHLHHILLQCSWQGSVALHSVTTSAFMARIWGSRQAGIHKSWKMLCALRTHSVTV